MREGDGPVNQTSRQSLRLLGSVGEPINPGSLGMVLQRGRRRPLPDRRYLVADRDRRHPDHAAARRDDAEAGLGDRPFFGIKPASVDAEGRNWTATEGNLCMTDRWPGQMRTVYGDHSASSRPISRPIPGKYFTGDGCRRDEDGYLLDHRPRRRRASTCPATAWARRKSKARWSRTARSPKPPWSAIPTTSRARASTPMSR